MEQDGPVNHSQRHVQHDSGTSVISVDSSKEHEIERISELEDEVKQLAEKANTASQKYADYENEIRVLEAKLRQEQRKNSAPSGEISLAAAQAAQRPGISRFGSFMGTRKISGPDGTLEPGASREKELEELLVKEQTMRIAAEKKVKEVSAEIEDLSATLFEQANEMVATERKQNHELKERLQTLEEQQHRPRHQQPITTMDAERLWNENAKLKEKLHNLQQREADRKKRLERLEAANTRIERIRTMLQPP